MNLLPRKIILILLSLILIANILIPGVLGSVFKDPDVPNGEQIVWRWTTSENKQFLSIVTWHVSERNKKPVYEISLSSGERKTATYTINKSDLRLVYADVDEVFNEGKCKSIIEAKDGRQYLTYDYNNKHKEKVIDNHLDGYDGVILTFSLRGFPFGKAEKLEFYITPPFNPNIPSWSWKMWKTYAKFLGEEKVTVPAGTFDCYKLEMGASGGVIRRFTTEYYFWFSKEPPYRFVKYQDVEGKNITELMEIRSKGSIKK
jgi:hypothetical protein